LGQNIVWGGMNMKKPIYFITREHKENFYRLLEKTGDEDNLAEVAADYILASIGTMDGDEWTIAFIEPLVSAENFDFEQMFDKLSFNPVALALVKLAANLIDENNNANVNQVFSVLNDEYQAVAYQALLITFPSFSKSWSRRYEFFDD
jgi:hypothetical protein